MSKTRIADLTKAVTHAANAWPQRRGATNRPQAFERYNAAADRLVDDVHKSEPLTGLEMTPRQSVFGLQVMFRTCYIASLVASQDEMSPEQLTEAMNDPRSFDVLEAVQLVKPVVAERAEEELGIIPSDRSMSERRLTNWQFSDGALTYNGIDAELERLKDRVMISDTEGECPLRKAKLNRPMFDAVVRICARDQNLFLRSLANGQSAYAREDSLPLL